MKFVPVIVTLVDAADVKATFAAEIGRTNGPFDNPEGWDRYKLWSKLTFATGPGSSLTNSNNIDASQYATQDVHQNNGDFAFIAFPYIARV